MPTSRANWAAVTPDCPIESLARRTTSSSSASSVRWRRCSIAREKNAVAGSSDAIDAHRWTSRATVPHGSFRSSSRIGVQSPMRPRSTISTSASYGQVCTASVNAASTLRKGRVIGLPIPRRERGRPRRHRTSRAIGGRVPGAGGVHPSHRHREGSGLPVTLPGS